MTAIRRKDKINWFSSSVKPLGLFPFFLTSTFAYSKKRYLIHKYYIISMKNRIAPVEVLRYQRGINPQKL